MSARIQSIRVIDPPSDVVAIRVLDPEHSPQRFKATAAVVLSSNCLVHVRDDGQLIRADAWLGLAAHGLVRASAVPGQLCEVETAGVWNGFAGLQPGRTLFLGSNGQATHEAPTGPLHQEVAQAISPARLSLSIQTPVIMS